MYIVVKGEIQTTMERDIKLVLERIPDRNNHEMLRGKFFTSPYDIVNRHWCYVQINRDMKNGY